MKTIYILYSAILVIIMYGCDIIDKTEESVNTVEAIEAITDYTIASSQFQGVSNASDDAVFGSENTQSSRLKSSYPITTIEPSDFTTFPKKITVDFGTSGVQGRDGRVRKGKLIINLENGWYRQIGSVYTTTFEDYYQNNYKIEGKHIAINTGTNSEDKNTFNIKVEEGKITSPLGNTILYTQNTTRTWLNGESTPLNIWDDEYEIEGEQSGVSSNNVSYTLTIRNENPLLFDLECGYVKKGILDIDIENTPSMSLDFYKDEDNNGEADCSQGATLTIGNTEYKI